MQTGNAASLSFVETRSGGGGGGEGGERLPVRLVRTSDQSLQLFFEAFEVERWVGVIVGRTRRHNSVWTRRPFQRGALEAILDRQLRIAHQLERVVVLLRLILGALLPFRALCPSVPVAIVSGVAKYGKRPSLDEEVVGDAFRGGL